MGNVTTPIKGALAAYISHLLVSKLGMEDGQASYIADAAWLLLTAAITYAVPASFGSKTAGAVVAWLLARVMKVAPALTLTTVIGGSLIGCAAQQTGGPPPTPEEQHRANLRRCDIALTMAATGTAAAAIALRETDDQKVIDGVYAAVRAVDASVATYCEVVLAGGKPDLLGAALAGVRSALDNLTAMALRPSAPASVSPAATVPDPVPPVS